MGLSINSYNFTVRTIFVIMNAKNLLTTFLFSFLSFCVIGQGEANNWYFGQYAGLTFNTNPPTALLDGVLATSEGCATMSDKYGSLLFYTDGITVWNKNHQPMPNGSGLMGHPSAAQSGIIIPKPGSSSNYIIITVPENGSVGMRYSEVDMTLNGGLGDVLTSNKNTLMFAPSSEKVAVVQHANGIYYWVVGRYNAVNGSYDAKTYVSYLIDCNGVKISNPVISQIGLVDAQNWGYLVASPDGTKLASASSSTGIEITDFDNTTGQISNAINLGSLSYAGYSGGNYGVAFSPNSDILYASSITNWELVQWDLSASNIASTQTFIGTLAGGAASRPSYRGGALQLAPDGKIYVCQTGLPYLGVINNPNVLGTACNLVNQAIDLQGRNSVLGLPPFIQSFFNTPTVSYVNDCPGEMTQFTINGASYLDSVRWNFDDLASGQNNSSLLNPTHQFTLPGTYNVELIRYLDCTTDTIYRNVIIHPVDTVHQTVALCENGTFELPDHQIVSQTGSYTTLLQSAVTGCDSVVITELIAPQINFSAGINQGICNGNTAQLFATENALNYTWTPSNTVSDATINNPIVNPDTTTTYSVTSQIQLGNNLVTNGDFSAGNVSFSSGYVFNAGNTIGPGSYSVGTTNAGKPWWANCGDHTSGSGNMLIVDGADGIQNGTPIGIQIWCQTIAVTQNTDYAFSTWFTNVNNNVDNSYPANAELAFFINGVQIGTTQILPSSANICQWVQLYEIWNSGNANSVQICIKELGGGLNGNDFALDDISFHQICTVTDDVTVFVSDLETTYQSQNVNCNGYSTGLISTDTQGGLGSLNYSWNSGQNTADINNLSSGNYQLTVVDSIGCQSQISVTITEPELLTTSVTANNIVECANTATGSATVTIQGGTPVYSVTWDNQETGTTAYQLSPGIHQVLITDANQCADTASIEIQHTEPPILFISTNDVCLNTPSDFLSQADAGTGNQIDSYSWTVTTNSQLAASGNSSQLTATMPQAGNYEVTLSVTSSNGCIATQNTSFVIYSNPSATIEQNSECFQLVDFKAIGTHPENLSLTYSWDIGNNQSIESTGSQYEYHFTSAAPIDVRLLVTDSRGCKVEVINPVNITMGKADFIFPNVLSIRSLVGNNQFDLEKIMPNFNSCVSYVLTIVNRWGNTVFESRNNKDNPDLNCSHCFKGFDQSGKVLTSGTYFYELKGDYGIEKSGFITLIND